MTNLYKTLEIYDIINSPTGLEARSPIEGQLLGRVEVDTSETLNAKVEAAHKAAEDWAKVPPPRRGELVRIFGNILRKYQQPLGELVTLECGKILEEGQGEVQEMIDISDFAVGLSRQLYGLTIASERPGHRMMETWHPLGVVGVISAFNFPVAVWAWNAALALVCGNAVVWKPSEKAPLTALACKVLFEKAVQDYKAAGGEVPENLLEVVIAGRDVGQGLVDHPLVKLISATGSTRMGRIVGPMVAERFGRSLLELGGNNAMIACPSADLKMAARAILFSAVGTTGQRCTSLRRLFVHHEIWEELVANLKQSYASIPIGNPQKKGTLMGPLIDREAYESMQSALAQAKAEGGIITGGERVLADKYPDAYYVTPAIVEMPSQTAVVKSETFAPILYVMPYEDLEEALKDHNAVPQGLSSCIFTTDLREAEHFLSAQGSDCGIANVNIGPSGAEIGGAFGGEKETGGGRESGSDAWKSYMRRATNTVNYSRELPLAQGIKFGD